MKKRDLIKLGIEGAEALDLAVSVCSSYRRFGLRRSQLKSELRSLSEEPEKFLEHPLYGELAAAVIREKEQADAAPKGYQFREDLDYACWGEEIEQEAHQQMENACRLPISRQAALMPDAHLGYGLPIGGVLATSNAVIPYAVGVDIACRVMLTVLDAPARDLKGKRQRFVDALERNTRFGIGAKWRERKQHPVLDEDWKITPVTKKLHEIAWAQLGTSGSGNHFVEFGELTFRKENEVFEPGTYLALVSHSGSRGPGSRVANYYSRLAQEQHPDLPKALKHLAWLSMDGDGAEYWAAMELMGQFASANHHVIHESILKYLGVKKVFQVENHHNFAWKEEHDGEEYIVHRKGATPAAQGELGYIPGSMTAPGYLVMGKGNPASLNSCSHGAGRLMSRKRARSSMTFHQLKKILSEHQVELLSAGLDEAPHAYKDIDEVMKAQNDLVTKVAKFQPKLVKMAPEGERPED